MIIKLLKNIWTVYAITIFALSVIIVFPFYLFFFLFIREKADKRIYPITRRWAGILSVFYLIRLKKVYKKKLSKKKGYIFISNHRSMLDIPISASLIPGHFRFLAKDSLLKIPFLGRIIKGICITVDRKNIRDKSRSYEKMKETLEKKSSVLIFPEGTRSKTDKKLGIFQNGAFRLSLKTKTPIIIITLWETSAILKKEYFWQLTPGKVKCIISEEIQPEGDVESLKEKCFNLIEENIDMMEKLD